MTYNVVKEERIVVSSNGVETAMLIVHVDYEENGTVINARLDLPASLTGDEITQQIVVKGQEVKQSLQNISDFPKQGTI
ncbi:hypothetical protein [Cytobacillus pseudoceanisediminis]|uniref:hypothetical protein n=1 Tax=Cytobacillus pseudoceanisediminis TaxID=3051614 RepID=UPI003CF416B6